MSKKKDRIQRIIDLVNDKAKATNAALDEHLDSLTYGRTTASPEDERAFVAMRLQDEPPEWIMGPEGIWEYESPWIIALRDAAKLEKTPIEGAAAYYKNIERIRNEMKNTMPRRSEMRPQRGVM